MENTSTHKVSKLMVKAKKPWWASTHKCDPCCQESRHKVTSRGKEPPPAWAMQCWECFDPVTVTKGDWLAKGQAGEKDRPGQSLDRFLR